MNLDNEDVQDILRVLDSTSYDELELETGRFRLQLRRSKGGQWTQEMQALSAPQRAEAAERALARALPGETAEAGREPKAPGDRTDRVPIPAASAGSEDLHEVRPPMLGTFYRAPKPGAAPFVDVGSSVTADTVVCIVETMKLMNSVLAGVAGVVVEICLEDAQFADEGSVLLRIRPEDACA